MQGEEKEKRTRLTRIKRYDRTHLARIEDNPDIPPHLASNPNRYKWLLDRDVLGANFGDFAAADLERYLSKKKQVDAEPDFERPLPGVDYVLENTGEASEVKSPPAPALAPAAGPAPGASVEPPVPDSPPPPKQETDWRNAPLNYVVNEPADDEANNQDQPSTSEEERDSPREAESASESKEAITEVEESDKDELPQEKESDYSS